MRNPQPPLNDKVFHDTPPKFNASTRKKFFYIDQHFADLLENNVRTKRNRIFAIIAYGYFKASGQFYGTAFEQDLLYVAKKFGLSEAPDWSLYRADTRSTHRLLILNATGRKPFNDKARRHLRHFLKDDIRHQKPPNKALIQSREWLLESKFEIPTYDTLRDFVDELYKEHKNKQTRLVAGRVSKSQKALLDALFDKNVSQKKPAAHKLTILKRFTTSSQNAKIKENIQIFDELLPLYDIAKPIVASLDYTIEGRKRYALSVQRSQIFEISRRNVDDRNLHLLIFVAYQFSLLVDIFIETILACVKAFVRKCDELAKEAFYQQGLARETSIKDIVSLTKSAQSLVDEIENIMSDPTTSNDIKVTLTKQAISASRASAETPLSIDDIETELAATSIESLRLKFMVQETRSLQLKISPIVQRLGFDTTATTQAFSKAITLYQARRGKITDSFPSAFLTSTQTSQLERTDSNRTLLRAFFYLHIRDKLKNGTLNLYDSSQFQHVNAYGIPLDEFKNDFLGWLKKAEMLEFSDVDDVLRRNALKLDAQFQETNEHILENTNEFVAGDGLGGFTITSERNTSGAETSDFIDDVPLFDAIKKPIPLAQAIHLINQSTSFMDEFNRSVPGEKIDDRTFYAGFIALGEHMSPSKLAKLSHQINPSSLESAIRKYFHLETLRAINDRVIGYAAKLPLAAELVTDLGVHTSSDGLKYTVAYDSFNASRSFKYGGNLAVIAPYVSIDCRGLFTDSSVISGAEFEGHYTIDRILKNDVIKSDVHSTDSHGYGEAIFGLTEFLDIEYAPRIKRPGKRYLYAFKAPYHYIRKNYPIYPREKIDEDLIRKYWMEILRIAVSIKLRKVSASQIFKRMNSYSIGENPVYKALKHFGRIRKTLFLLRYADNVQLRTAITRQLNKGEAGNRLDRELAVGRPDYTQTVKEDQEIAETCKRFLKNVIVCWNMMYLSNRLASCDGEIERYLLLEKIRRSSLLTWQHFNFWGEYSFSDDTLRDSQEINLRIISDPACTQFENLTVTVKPDT